MAPKPETPSVGRIVHFVDREALVSAHERGVAVQPWPAVITQVNDDGTLELTVFPPEATTHATTRPHSIPKGEPGEANRWSWPPRGDE
jgi:hypothetical protein